MVGVRKLDIELFDEINSVLRIISVEVRNEMMIVVVIRNNEFEFNIFDLLGKYVLLFI